MKIPATSMMAEKRVSPLINRATKTLEIASTMQMHKYTLFRPQLLANLATSEEVKKSVKCGS